MTRELVQAHGGGKSEHELEPPLQLFLFFPGIFLTSHFHHHLKTLIFASLSTWITFS